MLEKIINSKTRLEILSLFFRNQDKHFYPGEIINSTKLDAANVHKELKNLLEGKFILEKKDTNRKYFCLNKDNIFYDGLNKVFSKYQHSLSGDEWFSMESVPNYYPMLVGLPWNVKWANDFLKSRGFKNKFSKLLSTYDDNINDLLIIKKEFDNLSQEVLDKVRQDPNWGHKYVDDLFIEQEKLIKATNNLEKVNLGQLNNSELYEVYEKYYDIYSHLHIFHWVQTLADFGDNIFSKYLMGYLKDKIKDTKHSLGEVFSALTTPIEESEPTKEYKNLLEILNIIVSDDKLKNYFKRTEVRIIVKELGNVNKELNDKIEAHTKKYGYLGYGTVGPGWGKDYFVDILGSLTRQNTKPQTLLDNLMSDKTNIENKQKEFVKLFNIDKKHQELFKFARGLVFTKGSRKEAMFHSYSVIENLFREIGRRYYLSVNQVRYFYPHEFKDLLLNDKFSAAKLNDRYKFSIYYSTGDYHQDTFLEGDEAREFLSKQNIIREEITDVRVMEGDCASPGRASGHAKIINIPQDMAKMEEGDVLISVATNPDLVPAIKKASAIVTDVGGITCHAAIVSRELGIPCVIGTKIATKALKDGDIVNVDATHGKVSIVR